MDQNNFSKGEQKICSNGARKTWIGANNKCKQLSGELLLYKDDPEGILSCQGIQDGVWVGLRKTVKVRDVQSMYLTINNQIKIYFTMKPRNI